MSNRQAENATGLRASRAAVAVVLVMALAHAVFFSWLAIRRHQMLRSGALDLGYTTQVVWNSRNGRLFEFSTLQNVPIDLPLDQFRRTDILLAYHVELLLAPLSLLYVVFASPVTLLILQATTIALGAVPAFLLARHRLNSTLTGLVFAGLWLMAPALQGAVLSDFHAVALSATLLMWSFYFLKTRSWGAFLFCFLIAMSAKEDIPLLAITTGLYVALWRGWLRSRRGEVASSITHQEHRTHVRAGAAVAVAGLAWFLICSKLLLPYFSGLPQSPFLQRLAVFGATPADSLRQALVEPGLVLAWLLRPEIRAYVGGLLATGGLMSVFSPLVLALSAPVLVANIFSTWSWTYSEGAHYSASIVPFIMASAIYGLGWLADRAGRLNKGWRDIAVNGLALLALGISAHHQWQVGMLPFSSVYQAPRKREHYRIAQDMASRIPPEAALTAQSNLYPHVAHRVQAYLFPALNGAEYVWLDVAGAPYPLDVAGLDAHIVSLLESGEFKVLEAQDGLLLLQRGPPVLLEGDEWRRFLSFALTNEMPEVQLNEVRFGGILELVGYDYDVHNVVTAGQLPATIRTYWRALKPLDQDYRFGFYFTREDGALVGSYLGSLAATDWYPTSTWQPGEIVLVETPVLEIGRDRGVLLAIVPVEADTENVAERLEPSAGDESVSVLEDGRLLELFRF